MKEQQQKSYLPALVLVIFLFLPGCSSTGQPQSQLNQSPSVAATTADAQVIELLIAHAIKVEVTAQAKVVRLLREDDRGLPHQKFLLGLSNGTTVLVAHDIKFAPRVPLNVGDTIEIHGEYIWNAKGGLIHWTHRSDTPRHESGWIDLNGVRYQ